MSDPEMAELQFTQGDRWLLEREQRNFKTTRMLSVLALVVAIAGLIAPAAVSQIERVSVAEQYLRALVDDDPRGPYISRGFAAEGSQADQYATTLGLAREALDDSGSDLDSAPDGRVTGAFGTYEVCFPDANIYSSKCFTYTNFEYSEQNRVSRFTVDGLPVEKVFRASDYEKTATTKSDAGSNQVRAYYAGKLWDPSGESKTLVLWIDRTGSTTKGRTPISFVSVTAQDGNEVQVAVEAAYFPHSMSFGDGYYAVVRVPDEARYLYVTWSGVPADESASDWVYNAR